MRWLIFTFGILILLGVDLLYFHRKRREISLKEGLLLSAFWISLALLFNVYIYFAQGHLSALEFFTGYLIEKSLSIDNLFVIALIFSSFKVALRDQHRILFWGIVGALLFRLLFILGGLALIDRFHWLFYILGLFLIFTGIKLLFEKEKKISQEEHLLVRVVKKVFPRASTFFIVLLVIEYTDIIFALDSVPAIFAITKDPFIIYTSNVFAILGLRSLYFVLALFLERFVYLKLGLAAILVFIGLKMLLSHYVTLPIYVTLGVILVILAICLLCSLKKSKKG